MRKKIAITFIGFLILAGCSKDSQPDGVSLKERVVEYLEYCDTKEAYCISVPEVLDKLIGENDVNVFTTKVNTPQELYYRVQPYHLSPACSPLITGASKTSSLDEAGGVWGKVDFWDDAEAVYKQNMAAEDPAVLPPVPLCQPPLPNSLSKRDYVECTGDEEENCENKQRQYELDHGMYSAYAFCSEKNGKTVVICISQITDNPQLAEEIFSTFRWAE